MGMSTTNSYPEFSPGQKVRTCYGETRTVLFQNGCQVFVAGSATAGITPRKCGRVSVDADDRRVSVEVIEFHTIQAK